MCICEFVFQMMWCGVFSLYVCVRAYMCEFVSVFMSMFVCVCV